MFIPTSLKIIIRRRPNAEGLIPLYLNFSQDRRKNKISLRKWIPIEVRDNTKGIYVNRHVQNASELNMFLRTQLNRAHEIILDCEMITSPGSVSTYTKNIVFNN